MKLVKTIYFDAAHYLKDYIGKCSNIHGHTWKVEITVDYVVNKFKDIDNKFNGILLDFTVIKSIEKSFDHKCLNDIITINPTAENLASIICLMVADFMGERLKNLIDRDSYKCFTISVKLWESKTSYTEINDLEAKKWLGLKNYESYEKFIK